MLHDVAKTTLSDEPANTKGNANPLVMADFVRDVLYCNPSQRDSERIVFW